MKRITSIGFQIENVIIENGIYSICNANIAANVANITANVQSACGCFESYSNVIKYNF